MKRLMGLSLVFAAAACGGGGGDDRVEDFIGTWTYDASSVVKADCMGEIDMNDLAGGTFTMEAGTSGDLQIKSDEPSTADCPNPQFSVSGSTASVSNARCVQNDQGIMSTTNIASYKLVLDSAGTKVTISGNGTLEATDGTQSVNCTISITATATKSAMARMAEQLPLFTPFRDLTAGLTL